MTPRLFHLRKNSLHRWCLATMAICGGVVCGIVEYFALLRSRIQQHRMRHG